MFVKKLVEKASIKKPGGTIDGLKPSDVEPRLVFHYGIPHGATKFAYDTIQKILAISTQDGRIKLYGRDNTQALLESPEAVPSKFLQFIQNKGILVNVTSKNQIEVWDLDRKVLSSVHVSKEDITSFTVMQSNLYIYVGDYLGNVSVLKLDQESCLFERMKYTIPLSASHGSPAEVSGDTAVLHALPQPAAESKRVLIVFRDGLLALWDIRESKSIFTTGGGLMQSQHQEMKKVTTACWACPFGSKVAGTQNTPIFKLNLGYKVDKIPIALLKWLYVDGKASRLYVMGASDLASTSTLQVILLNEHIETRMVKLGLYLPEPCIDMEIISSSFEQSKNKQDILVLIGKSGRIYVYDDCLIGKYLLQSQSKSSPSLPKEVMVKMPFADSSITDYSRLAKNIPSPFPFESRPKDGNHSFQFSGFTKVKNLYITGHSDGAINFWDLSCPFPIPLLSLKQQSEDDFSLSGIALTALYFHADSRLLISGDQTGMVRIFKFKPEPYAENSFMSFQGSSKRESNYIHGVKLLKVNGSVLSINISPSLVHLAVGSDQGYVSVFDIEGPTLLYQEHIASEISTGIISLQFDTCFLHGFEKNILVVATKDSSLWHLMLTLTERIIFSWFTDGQDLLVRGSNMSNNQDPSKRKSDEDGPKQSSLLICSEKAVYVYSLNHVAQGVKKVLYKKKFQSCSCCWASTFCAASDAGLALLLSTGKIEIRSLPELSLIRESSIRGFTYSAPRLNSFSASSICISWDGELIMMNGDQEMFIVSVLFQKENFRLVDFVSQVYRKELMFSQEGLPTGSIIQKEKKRGIFSSVMKGSKPKQVPEVETEDTRESIEELSTIFSTANFEYDIDLDDPVEKTKDQNLLAALNKKKLASKFQAFTGKIKQMSVKNEKNIKEEVKDEKTGAVDQIKKKYGFSLSGESSAAKIAQNKLQENIRKLQGINLKTTEMQETASSFSAMAKEVLRISERINKAHKPPRIVYKKYVKIHIHWFVSFFLHVFQPLRFCILNTIVCSFLKRLI
ncbi:syntaxin-binding protein [Salix suchowensis]|nr:syntaxin-binding protein [Salix suchowensis]